MPRLLRILFGVAIVAVMVGAPLAYKLRQDAAFRNFHVVREGVLYRSGQMTLAGLKRVLHDHGIKTVVTLRDAHAPGEPAPDTAEETYCKSQGYNHVRIPPRNWFASDGSVPAEKGLAVFRQVMQDPANYPVLIHCFAGIHRTGAYCAVYRMDFEHWPNETAIAELRTHGYDTLDTDWDILTFLENYQPNRPTDIQPNAVRPASFSTPAER
jgi:tyrosine-protein phosphatase SIW14